METAYSAVGDTTADGDQTQQPRVWIFQAFYSLHHLPVFVLNASLVLPQSFNGPDLFVVCKAGFHWVVWKEEDDKDSDDNGDETHQEEEDLP